MEKEKMINGEMYQAFDKKLKKERYNIRELCLKYNQLLPNQENDKKRLIKEIFGSTKGEFIVEPNFFCDYGYNISIGENFYINYNGVILDCAKVEFGDNVFIGPNCGFYTAEHPIDVKIRNEGFEYARPIKVGNNVWIGGNAVVLSGVTIGDNSIIGAGSVVVKDIPPNVVAVGNPCKVIKKLEIKQ